ncbi:MAG: DUF3379 family protein [Gammaproteobacteria bacterium]|nr:DUF3379 family protein [Gammaproteobacteria bacterium]
MNCDQARLQIGAEPSATSPALEEHLQACAACAGFRQEMRDLDSEIRRAFEQPPPAVAARRRPASKPVRREWALAASVLLAITALLGAWLLRPSDTLARDVVAHVQGEPESWLATQHLGGEEIATALRRAGIELELTSDRITYAQSCWFKGHYVPHLVVQTAAGPTTVMILRHEHVSARRSFQESGMTGIIVPAGAGSIAVLARGAPGTARLDAVAGQMQQDVRWLPPQR